VVGTAVGLNLLFGFPILPSVLVLAFDGIILRVVLSIVVRPSPSSLFLSISLIF
jgi:manganese transport protein